MGSPQSHERIRGWLREVAIARSERVVDVPGGIAVLNTTFAPAHDHNRLLLSDPADAIEVGAAADDVLGGAGCTHRLIEVQRHALAHHLEAGLGAVGYTRSDEIVMTFTAPPSPANADIDIVELDIAVRAEVATRTWTLEQPDWTAAETTALGERIRTIESAVTPTFLAIRREGQVVARADLYLSAGIAQVEEVMTDPAARRQGFASALVLEAARRAASAGAETVFLVADLGEPPAQLYRRLGFSDAFVMASYSR